MLAHHCLGKLLVSVIGIVTSCFIFSATTYATSPAPVAQTGQTTCYDAAGVLVGCAGTRQDGDSSAGVSWPSPRFHDNANGSVTDTLTGLIWLKNANCFGLKNWSGALTTANLLAGGACGLTDGTKSGAWRMPTIRELGGVADALRPNPLLPNDHPFLNLQANYWSSSSYARNPGVSAWSLTIQPNVSLSNFSLKTMSYSVWPVRSGQ